MKREDQRFRYKVSINIYKHHKRKQFDGRTGDHTDHRTDFGHADGWID